MNKKSLGRFRFGKDRGAVPAIEYRITSGALYRNGRKLADGVEDIQFAFFMDVNGDNLIDTGEVRGDGTGARRPSEFRTGGYRCAR